MKTIICCYKCKAIQKTLLRCISDDPKEKSPDYICVDCEKLFGRKEPDIANASRITMPDKNDVKKKKQDLYEAKILEKRQAIKNIN